jgi:hypothetical protein
MALLNPGEPMSGNVEFDRLRKENSELRHRLGRIQYKIHHMRRWGQHWEDMEQRRDGEYVEYDQVVNMINHWADLSKKVEIK